jgi:phenylpropionate dioxygenase-like ring-hydroxylating dioxygenase large terminal subunit
MSTVLQDGLGVVPLDRLIDRERRRISARVFTDPAIYELELEHIFKRTWICVGHVSEIPNPGDYVLRYIGEDPVIVARDRAGDINILLNVCSHRSMGVCRKELGNTRNFTCPYHGWTYDATGRLVGVPGERAMYDDDLSRAELRLPTARTETCAGLIFGNWDPDAPSLEDYLGPTAMYLRLAFDRTKSGLQVAGPPARFVMDANWKLPTDQFNGDAYHSLSLHWSMAELGHIPKDRLAIMRGVNIATVAGHHTRLRMIQPPDEDGSVRRYQDNVAGLPGMTPALEAELAERLSPAERDLVARAYPTNGNLFPSVYWMAIQTMYASGEPAPGLLHFRVHVPRGPGQVETMNWALFERDAPPEIQRGCIRAGVQNFGTSGIWDQDDAEAWISVQRALQGAMGRDRWFDYRAAASPPTEEFPGMTYTGIARDDCQWIAWEWYFHLMNGGSAAWQ